MSLKQSNTLTPSQCMANIIRSAMTLREESVGTLADKMHTHRNTVQNDLKDPDRIPQWRLWMYFTVLDIPLETVMRQVAGQFAEELIKRERR